MKILSAFVGAYLLAFLSTESIAYTYNRGCNAYLQGFYGDEQTPAFSKFSARGESSNPNSARGLARIYGSLCMTFQWDERWSLLNHQDLGLVNWMCRPPNSRNFKPEYVDIKRAIEKNICKSFPLQIIAQNFDGRDRGITVGIKAMVRGRTKDCKSTKHLTNYRVYEWMCRDHFHEWPRVD